MGKPFVVKRVEVTDGGMVTLEIPFSAFIEETGDPGSRVAPGDAIDLSSMVIRSLLYPDASLETVESHMNLIRSSRGRK